MSGKITEQLVLREDVLITPVGELRPEVRAQIECDDEDFAVSRPTARAPSSVVDADSAMLLERFRKPTTIVEAVILFGRQKGVDPSGLLEEAYPVIRRFLENRFLVPADETGDEEMQPRFSAGQTLSGGISVVRLLYLLEDTELYQVRRDDGSIAVLKIERPGERSLAALFRHEAEALRRLEGRIGPRLFAETEIDGRRGLLLEWCAGVDVETAAAEWRGRREETARTRLLDLCRELAGAYGALHEAGVVHGDVHPQNVLVDRHGGVRLVDFGLALLTGSGGDRPAGPPRGGVAFFFEPEYARAVLEGRPPPAASEAGEQYGVAALLYTLVTGSPYRDFSLERERMLTQIAEEPPLPFAERGLEAWPELEGVLARALSKRPEQRYPSLSVLREALSEVAPPPAAAAVRRRSALEELRGLLVGEAAAEGGWLAAEAETAPTASVTYGAAGVAYGLARVAALEGDPQVLALADVWASRAGSRVGGDEGFYNEEIEITPEIVGRSSPYHTASGVFAVQALVARALDDPYSQQEALQSFVSACEVEPNGLDLTLGETSILLFSALLLDAAADSDLVDPAPLRRLGDRACARLWQGLAAKPPIVESDVDYLGIAHGWAGFLYGTLQWCRASGSEPPTGLAERLEQLAELAEPTGRGCRWRWTLGAEGGPEGLYMPGWCNGTSGYVFLWTLAQRLLGGSRYAELAEGAGWDVWDAADPYPSLCCGLAGRSYALLNLYKLTEQREWLRRARELGDRAARERQRITDYRHSLYKGELALAVLAADLDHPEESAQPLFEEEGWPPRALDPA